MVTRGAGRVAEEKMVLRYCEDVGRSEGRTVNGGGLEEGQSEAHLKQEKLTPKGDGFYGSDDDK